MLKLIHTADVHLGARHDDLGEQAAAQRERQFAAFKATVDLAIAEKVDVVLIAGDLFDSNVQPRRSVERVAAELKRLVDAKIRTVIIPGTHDVYDRASIYRAYDLAAMAGSGPDDDMSRSSTPSARGSTSRRATSIVAGPGLRDQTRPHSPLAGILTPDMPVAGWHVGMVHGSIAIPGRTDRDEVVVTTEEIAASGLDYLALGHWHSAQTRQGRLGDVRLLGRARGGRPRPGPAPARPCSSSSRRSAPVARSRSRSARSGRTRFEKIDHRRGDG